MIYRTLYRAVSKAELDDWRDSNLFRCSANTIEAKQFWESMKAAKNFVNLSQRRNFSLPYCCILEIKIDTNCLEKTKYESQELDRYMAITIREIDLEQFNKCGKKIKQYNV
jgi:hypothetical protein